MKTKPIITLIKFWTFPEVIRIKSDKIMTDYYMESKKDFNRFFFLKNKYGLWFASSWIKQKAYKMETIKTDKMAKDLTIENFKSFLVKPNWREVDSNAKEYIYEFPVMKSDVVIKLYTSIDKTTGMRRDKCKDAIRVFAFNVKTNKPVTKSKRVYRTINWRKNVKNLVMKTYYIAKERIV